MLIRFRAIYLLLLVCLISINSYGFSIGLGPSFIFKTSNVDHNKWAVNIHVRLFEQSKWTFWGSAEAGVQSVDVVNPGAAPNRTAPDVEESNSGSIPFLGRAYIHIPFKPFKGSFSLGSAWYFTDLGGGNNSAVPNAIGFHQQWHLLQSKNFAVNIGFLLGINPFGLDQLTLLTVPDAEVYVRLGNSASMTLYARMVNINVLNKSEIYIQQFFSGITFNYFH